MENTGHWKPVLSHILRKAFLPFIPFSFENNNALKGRIWINENPYSGIVYAKHFFPIFPFSSLENTRNPKREHLQEKDQTIVIQNLINYCIPL